MEATTINRSDRDNLYILLDSAIRSLNKRGVNVVVHCYSGYYASIEVSVNGIRGIARKNIIIALNEETVEWNIIVGMKEYTTTNVTSVTNICRSVISKLSALVSKL